MGCQTGITYIKCFVSNMGPLLCRAQNRHFLVYCSHSRPIRREDSRNVINVAVRMWSYLTLISLKCKSLTAPLIFLKGELILADKLTHPWGVDGCRPCRPLHSFPLWTRKEGNHQTNHDDYSDVYCRRIGNLPVVLLLLLVPLLLSGQLQWENSLSEKVDSLTTTASWW